MNSAPDHPLRILIVDDHAILRDGLCQLLAEQFDKLHVGAAENGEGAMNAFKESDWDLVILDISLGEENGLDILKQIRALRQDAKALVLTMHSESLYAVRAFKAGAAGYLNKETAGTEVVAAIKKILAGGKYVSASVAEKLVSGLGFAADNSPHDQLSDREFIVMRMLALGKTVKEIASDLALSIKTVSTYRTRALTKLDFENNADLTRYALAEKLI